jgi:hypothetical protein
VPLGVKLAPRGEHAILFRIIKGWTEGLPQGTKFPIGAKCTLRVEFYPRGEIKNWTQELNQIHSTYKSKSIFSFEKLSQPHFWSEKYSPRWKSFTWRPFYSIGSCWYSWSQTNLPKKKFFFLHTGISEAVLRILGCRVAQRVLGILIIMSPPYHYTEHLILSLASLPRPTLLTYSNLNPKYLG